MSDRRSLTESAAAIGRAWWAPTMGRMTVKARIATATVAAALVVIALVVWNTPDVAANQPTTSAVVAPSAEEQRLRKELAALREDLDESRSQADGLRETLSKEQAARLKGAQDKLQAEQEEAARKAAAAAAAKQRSSTTSKKTTTTTTTKKPSTGDGPANGRNPSQPSAPLAPEPTPTTPLVTPSKAELVGTQQRQFGMYTVQAPFNFATFDDTASKSGATPTIVGYFSGWDKPYRPDVVTRSWQRGLMPLLTWESQPSDAANDVKEQADFTGPLILGDPAAGVPGKHDEYIRQYARDIATLGLPLGIRLNHEMNGDWYPWSELTKEGDPINGNRPGDYVAVWRHVHDIFEQEGANQYVVWLWAPNIVNNLPDPLKGPENLDRLYPGDDYVDWVGLSGYNRPPYREGNDSTFEYTFGQSLDQLRALTSKPILLAEIGASEVGGDKPRWVTSLFEAFTKPENDDVLGFVWFNITVTSPVRGELVTNDWRLDSRASTLEAFRAGITDPLARFLSEEEAAAAEQAAADAAGLGSLATAAAVVPTAVPTPAPTATPAATPTASPASTPSASPTPTPASTATVTAPPTTAPTTTQLPSPTATTATTAPEETP